MCPKDEQYTLTEIRKHLLATQSSESVQRFDMLFTNLQNSVSIIFY